MDSQNVIVYLPVQFLDPHPQNPRKDLGDLTELAASIRAVGVLQNLLVVPAGDRWRVVAGHRRLAASKLAGLSVVPCVIREMSEPEQLRTMLAENMQRSDLTVLEQADGIQLMLDLGDTVAQIADGTGLSETTVRRRMKLLELPREPLKDSLERGGRLEDYMALDRLKKPENREKVLRAIGTANFNSALAAAENEETREAKLAELCAWLDTWARRADDNEQITVANGYRYRDYYSTWTAEPQKPEDAGEVEYVYKPDGYGLFRVYALVPEEEREKATADDAAAVQRAEYEQRHARFAALNNAFAAGEALRLLYVSRMDEETASIPEVFAACAAKLAVLVTDMTDVDSDRLLAALGETPPVCPAPEEDDTDEEYEQEQANLRRIADVAREQPHRAVLAAAYCATENDAGQPYSFDKYCGSDSYSEFLRWMQEALGYPVSIEERQLEDGSHPLYKEGEAE